MFCMQKLQPKTVRAAALQKDMLIFVVVFPLPMILKAAATIIIDNRIRNTLSTFFSALETVNLVEASGSNW